MYDCFTCAPDNNNTKLVPGNEGGSGQRLSVCHYVLPPATQVSSICYSTSLKHLTVSTRGHPYAGL